MDQLFEWCEKRDMYISWNIWFHSYISEAVWGGGNARFRHNPYKRITSADNFFSSEEAWEYTTNLDRFHEDDLQLRLDTSEFQLAEWSPRVNGQIDLGAIVEFSVYVGEAGQGQGTIYIDAIRLSK